MNDWQFDFHDSTSCKIVGMGEKMDKLPTDKTEYLEALAKEFERCRFTDAIVHACLTFARMNGLSEDDGLRLAVVELSKANKRLVANLVDLSWAKGHVPFSIEERK